MVSPLQNCYCFYFMQSGISIPTGELSLWEQLENKVLGEIKNALQHDKFIKMESTQCAFTHNLEMFVCDAKSLKKKSTEAQEKFVGDMYVHLRHTFSDSGLFDFTNYPGLLI